MAHKLYHVRPGDTLSAIARWAGVPYAELLTANPQIANPNLIRVGQTILVPEGSSRTDLIRAAAEEVFPDDEPAWLKIARREIGVAERDPGENPRILEYLATTTLSDKDKQRDETAWCAAFLNWCLKTAGKKTLNTAWALSWAGYAKEAATPKLGDVVVFHRDGASSKGGHVGFFLRDLGTGIEIIGGNQSNAVTVASFPKNGKKGSFHYRFKAYRRP